jgi:hypothetical protein
VTITVTASLTASHWQPEPAAIMINLNFFFFLDDFKRIVSISVTHCQCVRELEY